MDQSRMHVFASHHRSSMLDNDAACVSLILVGRGGSGPLRFRIADCREVSSALRRYRPSDCSICWLKVKQSVSRLDLPAPKTVCAREPAKYDEQREIEAAGEMRRREGQIGGYRTRGYDHGQHSHPTRAQCNEPGEEAKCEKWKSKFRMIDLLEMLPIGVYKKGRQTHNGCEHPGQHEQPNPQAAVKHGRRSWTGNCRRLIGHVEPAD